MHKKLLKGVYFHTANKSFYNLNKSYRNFSVKTNKNKVARKHFASIRAILLFCLRPMTGIIPTEFDIFDSIVFTFPFSFKK